MANKLKIAGIVIILILTACGTAQKDTDNESKDIIKAELTVTNTPIMSPITDQSEAFIEFTPEAQTTYIFNTNTKKFHLPNCTSVNIMSDKNKKSFTGSRDEAIAEGYSPCLRCNP